MLIKLKNARWFHGLVDGFVCFLKTKIKKTQENKYIPRVYLIHHTVPLRLLIEFLHS